jgi:D-glycero-alpha-D-manno-heptose-7-phosphate kinase
MELHEILKQGPVEASAPCRIDMGGTLDLSTFHLPLRHLGPCTFNMALDLRTQVRLSPFTKGKIKVTSTGFDTIVVDSMHASYAPPLGLMLAVAAYFKADGIHMEIQSASPPQSALGGSSVAVVALIWAFSKALSEQGTPMPERKQVALLAHAIEQAVAGVPCGLQDQLAAAFGGVNGWYWAHKASPSDFSHRRVIPEPDITDLQRSILLAYCGVPHVSKNVNATWVNQFIEGRHRRQWCQIIECCQQFIDAVSAHKYDRAGELMNQETDIRQVLTPEVLDEIGGLLTTAARKHACGARFAGAGAGGCIWALGPYEKINALRPVWNNILAQRKQAHLLDVKIDTLGVL